MRLAHLISQKSYEQVLYPLRRHPVTFLPTVFLFFILLIISAIVYFLINHLFPVVFTGPIIRPLALLFGSGYLIAVLILFYTQFVDFYLDLWIITNDRLIDIEQFGLFARTITEVDLFQIQDVTTVVKGFFPTFLNYGDLQIKTASSNENIVLRDIPRPNFFREEIIRLAREDRKYHSKELSPTDINPAPVQQ